MLQTRTSGFVLRRFRATAHSGFSSDQIGAVMTASDQSNELSIAFSPETMRAREAAAALGLSVPDFAQEALRRFLIATGDLQNQQPPPR